MGLFGKGKGGGLMNVIRCDEPEYLVWKWRPDGQELGESSRENSIRYGSSLRVKDGEVAVFVYKQPSGAVQDYIVGPYDETIKTQNFPVLASIVGTAFGGESPFQAEIYFINLAGIIQVKFAIPYFGVQDPRFPDLSIPISAGGTFSFRVEDYKEFIKVNRLINFSLDDFENQVKDAVIRRVKGTLANVLFQLNCPLVQIERNIEGIGDILRDKLKVDFEDFGVVLRRFDLSRIEPDKEDENWGKLQKVTADFAIRSTSANQDIAIDTAKAQADVNIQNLAEMQRINAENMAESLRIQREERQYAQHLGSQSQNMGAYQAALQADVLKTGAQSLGQMGSMDMGGGNGGFNPAGMMTGMAMGGAMGQQMAGMMNTMGQQINQSMAQGGVPQPPQPPQAPGAVPPPPPGSSPNVQYSVASNGQTFGPFNWAQLQQLVQQGQLTQQSYVWKQGMAGWEIAGNIAELSPLFGSMPPPPPTM